MAKVSPVSIKYMIHANFEVEGALEKPDVIGAIFGQTEGLLGEYVNDLDGEYIHIAFEAWLKYFDFLVDQQFNMLIIECMEVMFNVS